MEHIEDNAGGEGAGGMALMGCDIQDMTRLQDVGGAGDGELERAAQQQGPLLVGVGVIGDDGARRNVHSALGDLVRVEIAAEVAGYHLTGCNGSKVE
jgi:hypothetical protein